MRKIPGVNNHIFKQPRIPFQEGYPYTLGSSLVGWWSAKDSNITLGGVGGTGVSLLSDKSSSGADFIQPTEAQQPNVDNALNPSRIDFLLAGSEYLYNINQINKINTLSQGSIIYINDNKNLVTRVFFSIDNNTNNVNYLYVGVNSSNKAQLEVRVGGGAVNRMESTNPVSDGDVIEWSSNGMLKSCKINGVVDDVVVTSGVNESDFLSSPLGLNEMALASRRRFSFSYSDILFRELIITSTPLTDQKSLDVANYLTSKHNL